ncbi:MAG: cytochrome c oxidase subunit 3 [Gemmatimonadaceae bacterium]
MTATRVTPTATDALPLAVNAGRHSPGWWGMVAVLTTEGGLFVLLLFSYIYTSAFDHTHWMVDGPPDLKLALPNTLILLVSSATAWWGEKGIKSGSVARLRIGLSATLMLGIAFAGIQGKEYANKKFGPARDAYSSLFYTITGFHFAHVIVGLIMLATVLIWASKGVFTERRHLAVTNVGLYWHFVDAVWLGVFTTLYLVPHLK